MANVDKIKNDIKNLKAAIKNPKTPSKFLPNLKQQLQKAQIQLDATKKPLQKVAVKSATSSVAYKRAIELAKKYRLHQTGVPKSKSDIEKDADRPAMPTGKRISQGLRANKSGSKKSNKGHVYYEYRENRIDRKQPPKRYPKLEDGGMMAMGGLLEHGLKVGDKIVDVSVSNSSSIRVINDGVYAYVDLARGTRKEGTVKMPNMEHGGKTHGSSVDMGHIKSTEHRIK